MKALPKPMLLAFLILSASFVACFEPAAAQEVGSGAIQAPWWPTDRSNSNPTNFRQGWNLRIPITIQDAQARDLSTPVQLHLDLAKALVEGGWPHVNGLPNAFAAYPESVRLIEYTENWAQVVGEVPVHVFPTWLDPVQSHKTQISPFHERRNALVTLEWQLPRPLGAGATHYYFVYFDIVQNAGPHGEHRKSESTLDREKLDGLYWVGSGTTLYGYFPHQNRANPSLMILAPEDNTSVQVYTYRGKSIASVDNRPGVMFNFTVNSSQMYVYRLGLNPTHFRVEASKPVSVLTYALAPASDGRSTHVPEFVPAARGGLLGSTFLVPPVASGIRVIVPPSSGRACVSIDGQACVNINRGSFVVWPLMTGEQGPAGEPIVTAPALTRVNVISGGPVLVQFAPRQAVGAHPAQAAAVSGAGVGSVFIASTFPGGVGTSGFRMVAWNEPVDVDVCNAASSHAYEGQKAVVPPPSEGWRHLSGAGLASLPYTVKSVDSSVARDDAQGTCRSSSAGRGLFQLRVGSFGQTGTDPVSQTTPFGGRHGMEFHVQGSFVIYNYYPDTRFELVHHWDGGRREMRTVGPAGVPVEFRMAHVDHSVSIQSDKPLSVFPLGLPVNYARFLAAKPPFLNATAHVGEYRGYLFDVRAMEGGDPVFLTGLPGKVLNTTFQVRNLGRWTGGTPLPDTIRFSAEVNATVPSGSTWSNNTPLLFEHPSIPLSDDSPRTNRLQIAIPEDVPSGTQLTVRVAVESEGNPQMNQTLTIVVLVRQTFGVDMWFGPRDSISGPIERTHRFPVATMDSSAAEVRFPFVVQNKGSGDDSFTLSVTDPIGGWSATIEDPQGRPLAVTDRLPSGGKTAAVLVVRAPTTQDVARTEVQVSATSVASRLAQASIVLDARLSLEQKIELEIPQLRHLVDAGSSVRIPVVLVNSGEDGFSVRVTLDALSVQGWSAVLDGLANPGDPIALRPGQRVPFEVVVAAPAGARADALFPFLLRAEGIGDGVSARDAVSLTGIVRHRSHLVLEAPEGVVVVPGQLSTVPITIRNLGNGPDTVELRPFRVPGAWLVAPATPSVTLDEGDQATVDVVVTPPAGEPPSQVEVILEARTTTRSFTLSVPAEVQARHDLTWSVVSEMVAQPAERLVVALRLENRGSVTERLTLQATGPWPAAITPSDLEIPPLSSRAVSVEWQIPAEAEQGVVLSAVQARAESGASARLDVPVRVEIPALESEGLSLVRAPDSRNPVGVLVVALRNEGEVPVRQVQVRLLGGTADGDGQLLDSVTIESVGLNGSAVVPLRWRSDVDGYPRLVSWVQVDGEHVRVLGNASVPLDAFAEGVDQTIPLPGVVMLLFAVGVATSVRVGRTRGR